MFYPIRRLKKLIILLLPVLFELPVLSQDYGVGMPFITSFNEKDFSVSNQNWDVVQDSRQVMYFANDYGVLEFDGSNWNIIQVPLNRSTTRSTGFREQQQVICRGAGLYGIYRF